MPYKDPEKQREHNRHYRQENLETLKSHDNEYHAEHKEERNEYSRQYYRRRREKWLSKQDGYNYKTPEQRRENSKSYYYNNRESILAKKKKSEPEKRRVLRLQAIEALGSCCAMCGIADTRVLEIDHVNGDGCLEKTRYGALRGLSYYKGVIANIDGRYQLLCANCHRIKTSENDERSPYAKRKKKVESESKSPSVQNMASGISRVEAG